MYSCRLLEADLLAKASNFAAPASQHENYLIIRSTIDVEGILIMNTTLIFLAEWYLSSLTFTFLLPYPLWGPVNPWIRL